MLASYITTAGAEVASTAVKGAPSELSCENNLPVGGEVTQGVAPYAPTFFGYSRPDYVHLQANKSVAF